MNRTLLSVLIPCYNSQDYMTHCIESILSVDDNRMEILIINDGSGDGTAEIADQYAEQYPQIIRAVHQENKGHGGAVNTGIEKAKGLYIKVVDSDDWVNDAALKEVLSCLREFSEKPDPVDLLISNFVYEKEGVRFKKTVRYRNVMPHKKIFGWDEMRKFRKSQYLLMHSLIYRTDVLRECGLHLPEHTFYVDNLFAFVPLNHVRTMYYLDLDFYRYYIGREDQSVNEKIMISRIDQQLKVNQLMIDHILHSSVSNRKLKRYMCHYLEIIMTVSSILLVRSRQNEHLDERANLWRSVKHRDRNLYMRLRYSLLGTFSNLPGTIGRSITIVIYKLTQKLVGFN